MSLKRFFRRAAWDDERTREMDAHLRLMADDFIADGLPPDEAWRAARRAFGNARVRREEIYDMNSITLVEHVVRDARYAIRVLRKSPGFAVTALLTLALAVGVNTAVFSIVDAALLKPLPYQEPERLTLVSTTIRERGDVRDDIAQLGLTWETVRDHAKAIDAGVYSSWPTGVNLVTGSTASYVQQQRVGSGFFRILGVQPIVGREFSTAEDRTGGPAAVILSHELWQKLYGGDASAIGRSLTLRGEPYQIVGVMPAGFRTSVEADVWTPLRASRSGEGDGENFTIVARLRAATTLGEAQAEMRALGTEIVRQRPPRDGITIDFSLVPMQHGLTAPMRDTLLMLWAAVALILIIACVNLSGLLLARAASRRRELATRIALGSGRLGVVRQAIVESLILGLAGGALGLAVGYVMLDVLASGVAEIFDFARRPALDARAVAAAATLSLAAALTFGIAPTIVTANVAMAGTLSDGSRTTTRRQNWPRKLLLSAQVALGVVLLVAAGLLVRSFTHLRTLQPGFNPENVTVATVSLQDARYRTSASVQGLFDGTLSRLRATPGISGAAVSLGVPYERLLNLGVRFLDGPQAVSPGRGMTSASYVTEGFFDALQVPLRSGRGFSERDTGAAPAVAVVNETFARTYFKESALGDVVGRRIGIGGRDREIVGVAADVQVRPGWGNFGPLAPMPLTYLPVTQVNDAILRVVHGWFSPAFVVRTDARRADAAAAIRRALEATDPLLPIARVRTMTDVQGDAIAPARLIMTMLVTLAVAAMLLAAVGIHGLVATSVAERRREIGIRLALGSTRARAMRAVAMPGTVLAIAGVALGLPLAAAFVRLVRHFVWGVRDTDPVTFAAAALTLLAVAAAASIVPALRVLRLDPAVTLRHE